MKFSFSSPQLPPTVCVAGVLPHRQHEQLHFVGGWLLFIQMNSLNNSIKPVEIVLPEAPITKS